MTINKETILDRVAISSIAIKENDFSLYLEYFIKELDYEKRLLQEIGGTFLPMLLGYINPSKSVPLIRLDNKSTEKMLEQFIDVIKNMHDQRAQHEKIFSQLAAYLKPIEEYGFDKIKENAH